MEQTFVYLAWLGLTYVIGSIPFGLFIAKVVCKEDPRLKGSGNTGATNVARTCGKGWGLLTLILDAGKGFVPVAMATAFSDSALFLSLTGLAALIGHMYSVLLSGRGGKGVATTIGVFLALTPWSLFIGLVLFLTVVKLTGFVSLGSLALVGVLPVLMLLSGNFSFILFALIVMCLVFWAHRENIVRLAHGQETAWHEPQDA